MSDPTMIGLIGVSGDGGPADAAREARNLMERYAVEHGYRLHILTLIGDARADADVYARLESRVRRDKVVVIATWGRVQTGIVSRLGRAHGGRVMCLDGELSEHSFPFAYFSLTPEQRGVSVWARLVDELPGQRRR